MAANACGLEHRLTPLRVLAATLVVLGLACSKETVPEKSVLRQTLEDAGSAQERYADLHNGKHARAIAQLEALGLHVPEEIELRIASVNNRPHSFAREYCIEGRDVEGTIAHFDNLFKFTPGPCDNFWFGSDDR